MASLSRVVVAASSRSSVRWLSSSSGSGSTTDNPSSSTDVQTTATNQDANKAKVVLTAVTTGVTTAASAVSSGVTTAASAVSSGVSSAASLLLRSNMAEPEVKVVTDGLGSMLHVKLLENSSFYTTLGSAIGMATDVETEVTTEGGPIKAFARMASGGDFFLQRFYTQDNKHGDILIAPKSVGDVAAIKLEDGNGYYIARHAYLGNTPQISLSPRYSKLGVGLDSNYFHIKVSGLGVLAIHAHGGIFRVALGPGESYQVNPKHLIAWQASMKTENVKSNGQVKGSIPVLSFLWSRAATTTRGWATGGREFVSIYGPGEVFLSSRLEAKLPSLKSISGLWSEPVVVSKDHKPVVLKDGKPVEEDTAAAVSTTPDILVKNTANPERTIIKRPLL